MVSEEVSAGWNRGTVVGEPVWQGGERAADADPLVYDAGNGVWPAGEGVAVESELV
jgi:hypothetical protein